MKQASRAASSLEESKGMENPLQSSLAEFLTALSPHTVVAPQGYSTAGWFVPLKISGPIEKIQERPIPDRSHSTYTQM